MINKICEFQLKKEYKKKHSQREMEKKKYKQENELFSFKFVSLFTRYLSIIGFD